jgi:hypothetical protein
LIDMSTPEGENKDGQSWPTQSDSFTLSSEQLELQHHRSLSNAEITSRGHARLANHFRDDYMALGDPDSLGRALHHYEAALSAARHEPLLRAWIICNRANLYVYDLQTGKVLPSDLAEELALAKRTLSRTVTRRGRDFKAHTLEWINATQTAFAGVPETPEDTQDFTAPALRLVGGTAIEGAVLPVPVPGPEAA